ncbi:uncharacterized protein [Hyperolius riggenbachi]|uniref:uncharacterized protein n=1 Tax=Hyperolius riggenbachi TaxID=752182 RepID=UPI0035A279EB
MVGIVPKKKCKTDFCGVDNYYYIVRPEVTCYMRATNFNRGEGLEIFSLHPSCRDGDHYLAHNDDLFYIIKGNYYRRVSNMNTDEGAVVYTLHPNCQGGSHYLSAFGNFYIIFQDRGVYRRTTNMNQDSEAEEFALHPNCKNGLYYFGVKNYYYFVKPHDEWGVQYVRCTNFNTSEDYETFSFHPSVISFLPGGMSITKGPSYGEWVCIKTIKNDSQVAVEWKKQVTKKVGYEKEKTSSMEHNWKVSATVSAETGGLSSVIAKSQFSFTTEYGGKSVNTERENWSEATEVQETITVNLQPGHQINVFVYVLGMGKDAVLHCRDMRILDSPNPPTDVPLPPISN